MAIWSDPTFSLEGFENSSRPEHIAEIIRWRALQHPDQDAYIFLADGELDERRLTFADLDRRAATLAAQLVARGLSGERALLVYEPGLDYIVAFYACLYAGVIAVPVYPPDPLRLNRLIPRLMSIVRQAEASVVLSTTEILGWSESYFSANRDIRQVLATDLLSGGVSDDFDGPSDWQSPPIDRDSLAFLQYTSGSEGEPKGVMLTHGNLLCNLEQMRRVHHDDAITVMWLPPYHDMGLIGAILLLAYRGRPLVLMSPLSFVQRPLRWLEAISRFRATSSGGPNFGYDLCVKKIDDAECAGLDLSAWRLACNGSEPIRAETLRRFHAKFQPYGLRWDTFCPCYGLAEATLMVSCAGYAEGPIVRGFDADQLALGRARPLAQEVDGARTLVSSGPPVDFERIAIIDPKTRRRAPVGDVGEIWIQGGNVGQGYWGLPEESRRKFEARVVGDSDRGRWLRTGDLGFLLEGQLFVTGRIKDVLIVAGRNFYPHDIERSVAGLHPHLKADGGAAFSIDEGGEERVVIVEEVTRPAKVDLPALARQIRAYLLAEHQLPVAAVALIAAGTLPKTSSGKTQRHLCKQRYLAGELRVLAEERDQPQLEDARAPDEPPRSTTEQRLADLWREVLQVGRVGRHDRFLDLGGQSLLAAQLLARINREWNLALPLVTLFEASTLAALAERIDDAHSDNSTRPRCSAAPPARVDRDQPLALSPAQERMWFLDRLGARQAYNVAAAVELNGPLDAGALRRALDELVSRHEILRTVYCEVDGQARQIVCPPEATPLPVVDLRPLDRQARERSLDERLREAAAAAIDLERGPIFAASLFRLAENQHALLLRVHHIAVDGWSFRVLIEELSRVYQAFLNRQPSPLVAMPMQYADYAAWQRQTLDGGDRQPSLAYWRQQLDGAPREIALPADRRRHQRFTLAGALAFRRLPDASAQRIAAACRREQCTLFMFLTAGMAALLERWTGQDDLVFGAAVSQRTLPELESLVGLFINMLPLRIRVGERTSFRQLLDETRRATLDMQGHCAVPFEQILQQAPAEDRGGASPLFNFAIFMQEMLAASPAEGPLTIKAPLVDNGRSKFDLSIYCWQRAGGLELTAEYSVELFDAATIDRLLGSLATLLDRAASHLDTMIADLPLHADSEREKLLDEPNRTERRLPAETLVELLAEPLRRGGDRIAVTDARGAMSYAELDRRSNQLARYLRRLGVGPDERVGLFVNRSADMLVALLGILKAGGAYVPLDPAYPPQRLQFMLDDADARVLATQRKLVDLLPPHRAEEVLLDDHWPDIARMEAAPVRWPVAGDSLAYTIYTSGSTGRPKGVEVPHRALVNFLCAFQRELRLDAQDTLAAVTTLSFDIAGLEMFLPLLAGARVVIAPREVAVDGRALGELLEREAVTFMQATPSAWRLLLAADWRPDRPFRALCGGEGFATSLAQQLFDRCAAVWNVYGPTETTIWSTLHRVMAADAASERPLVTIGRPIDNTQVYVLDGSLRPAPVGAAGELCLGGAGLARGYRNLPELTAEKFIEHRFGDRPATRLYRTGDRVRWLNDGTLEFLARGDRQIKIRGHRVELGEIESVLLRSQQVRDATVRLFDPDSPGARLVAYVAPRAGHALDVAALRRELAGALPDYMLPAAVVRLDALPRLPNGKLDARRLPAAPHADSATATYLAPAAGAEQALAEMWRELLHVGPIGRHDRFFELGGHSLLAMQLVARIRAAWEIDLPLGAVFETPRLADLAAEIDRFRRDASTPARPKLARRSPESDGSLPMSFTQERLWFLAQMEPRNPFYNLATAARLSGPLDAGALEESIRQAIERHESLRTAFTNIAGQPRQRLAAAAGFSLHLVDLRSVDNDDSENRAAELEGRMRAESQRPFALDRWPLLRAMLYQLGRDEHVLLLVMHHIVADGWSLGSLVREVADNYEALVHRRPRPHKPLAIQYADFAAWQRRMITPDSLTADLEWWRQALAESAEPLNLPTDFRRPAAPQFHGAHATRGLSRELSAEIQRFGRAEGVTLFMTLTAAFQALLGRYSAQSRFCLGTAVANRTEIETEPLIGYLANTLVVPTDLTGNPTFRELLGRAKRTLLGVYAHQDTPFEKVVEAVAPQRSRGHAPLFQVALVLENAPLPLESSARVRIEPLMIDNGTSKYDLTLFGWERQGQISLTAEYSTELFRGETIDRLLRSFETLLSRALSAPETRLDQLPILAPADLHRALVEFNRTERDFPREATLQSLIADAAERHPQSLALVSESHRLTFADLEAQANRLARQLIEQGIGRGSLVAICAARSPLTVVAMLAALKSGAAYLPLDDRWPARRIAEIVADAQVSTAIVDEQNAAAIESLGMRAVTVGSDAMAGSASAGEAKAPCQCRAASDDAAYVIYTSGSTGRPKGVAVSQRALVNHAVCLAERMRLDVGSRLLQFISPSFDAAAEEIFPALVAGATLVFYPAAASASGGEIVEFCERQSVDVWHLPTAVWRQLVDDRWTSRQPLQHAPRLTLVGGEPVSRQTFDRWRSLTGGRGEFLHAYGLTEAAITSTLWRASLAEPNIEPGPSDAASEGRPASGEPAGALPIGRPIANTRALVLDSGGNVAPIGVPGELYLAGEGLARGYYRAPELTAQRFVPCPAPLRETVAADRLLRTGDRVRWLADGNLEFLGRIDEQIKLQGLSIEPAEIEAALVEHPAVRQAVVLLNDEQRERPRLAAYIVPGEFDFEARAHNERGDGAESRQVGHWQTLFDRTYREARPNSHQPFNTIGWNSSYTGQPLSDEEMSQWRDATVERVLGLRPAGLGRVLEIGCGVGALLLPLAARATEYWGTDFSRASLDCLRDELGRSTTPADRAQLRQQAANDFAGLPEGTFDLVILNSVAQYFPSVEYLTETLAGAARLLRAGGAIFVGDLRNLQLLAAFHASVEVAGADEETTVDELRERVRRRSQQEQELCLDPAFFPAWAAASSRRCRADVQLKSSGEANELTKHRYDATLRFDGENTEQRAADRSSRAFTSLAELRAELSRRPAGALRFTGVPNARVAADVRLGELLEDGTFDSARELRAAAAAIVAPAVELLDLERIAREFGYQARSDWSAGHDRGAFDVWFCDPSSAETPAAGAERNASLPAQASASDWRAYANDPLRGVAARRLVPELRKRLQQRLPAGWMPSSFTLLNELPLTTGGKIDRRALRSAGGGRPEWSRRFRAPSGEAEILVAGVFERLLNVRPVGADDHFFELGGHSMLAVQLVAELENATGRRLPLNVLFQQPTVAALARLLAAPLAAESSSLIPIQPLGRKPPLFAVHPAGGTVFCYRELAAALGTEQPLYGLQAVGLDGHEPPHAGLAEMAAHYVAAMKSLAPAGPYRICGWSLGGNIAFEMARQLRAAGEEVSLLALIDSGLLPENRVATEHDFLSVVAGLFPDQTAAEVDSLRELTSAEQLAYFVTRARRADLMAADAASPELMQRVFDVFQANVQALLDYRPEAYRGLITLLKAAEQNEQLAIDETLGWRPLAAGGIEIVEIAGSHVQMLTAPHVHEVARAISEKLAEVDDPRFERSDAGLRSKT